MTDEDLPFLIGSPHVAPDPAMTDIEDVFRWAKTAPRPTTAAAPDAEIDPDDDGSQSAAYEVATRRRQPRRTDETGPVEWTDAHLVEWLASDTLAAHWASAPGLGWLQWDGRRWASSDESAVTEAVRRHLVDWHAREGRAGADSGRLKQISGLLSRNRIGALVGLLRGHLRVDAAAFDQHPDLLNVGNGIVSLATGELQPHDPSLRLTKLTPVNFTKGVRHADFDAALQAVPDAVANWMQVRVGQAASGHMTPDDTMLTLHGSGANGKSVLLDVLRRSLGEHAVTVPERVLLANPSDHPTELMTLRGARMAVIEELPEGGRLSVKRLKDTVGTSPMTARLIRQDNVTWEPTHSLFLATNYLPVVNEVDHGTWRRLVLLTFPYTFVAPGAELRGPQHRHGDPRLRERLNAGLDGQHEAALSWIVEGARRWYSAGRVMPALPEIVGRDTQGWRASADRIHAYVSERLTTNPDSHMAATDLFADFSDWLASHGHATWSDQTFAGRFGTHELITAAGVERRRVSQSAARSRRPGTLPTTTSARYIAWLGVGFRAEHGVCQGWQGASDDGLRDAS